ncbi:MAG: hypothetical protein AAF539_06145 [Planctomycetota bacterium]
MKTQETSPTENAKASDQPIVRKSPQNVIVAGIARSGMTAMCQLLSAGGLRVAGEYPAFEPFDVGEVPWGKIDGQAVKLVDSHRHLPPEGDYAVIQMRRNDKIEQAKSTQKFVRVMMQGMIPEPSIGDLVASFQRDYRVIDDWANRQRLHCRISFEDLLWSPKGVAQKIRGFLGFPLDVEAAGAVIIRRAPECHPTLLEASM